MGSRAARNLLGPLVDGYRDLAPAKQTLSRPGTAKGQTWARSQWEEMDLGGGGGGAKAAEIFKRYDGDNTGNIDEKEMMQALQELGVLDPKDKKAAKALRTEMKDADTNQDGMISFIEFLGYFQKMARYRADLARTQRIEAYGQPLDLPPSYENNPTLQQCFKNFCVYGRNHGIAQGGPARGVHAMKMNNFQFIHLCKDAGFAEPEGRLHREALDVIFFRAAQTGQRQISFKEFLQALAIISEECGIQLIDAAVQLGADPATLHGTPSPGKPRGVSDSEEEEWKSASRTYDVPSKVASAWRREKKIRAKKRAPVGQGIALQPALHASEGMQAALNGTIAKPTAQAVSRKQLNKMLSEARQQSVEEVNQRWAAKSHGLLSRISNLERQLQGQSPDSPSASSPSAQDAQEGSIVVSGAEGYHMEDPRAEMDLLRHEIDISIDQKLRGVEKRLQVSNALSSLKQDLEAQVDARFQNLNDRLQALENQSKTQLKALEAGVAALQRQPHSATAAGGAAVSVEAFEKLASNTQTLQTSLSTLAQQMHTSHGRAGMSKAELQAALMESERRLAEKHSRLEGAVVQVAGRVDMLDGRVKQEQESSLRALEAILSESGHGKH